MSKIRLFHLSIPVSDLQKSKIFYHDIMGCKIGRNSHTWVDYNFFNHQLVTHLSKNKNKIIHNIVDQKTIPIPHFGIILNMEEWTNLVKKIEGKVEFLVKPHTRFKGHTGEQATMFFKDPDNNCLEFKAFKSSKYIFKN